MHRLLPPYPRLRQLIVDQGLTYREVADMYQVKRSAVQQTFKRGVIDAGETWPILDREEINRRIAVREETVYIDSLIIRGLVSDAVERQLIIRSEATRLEILSDLSRQLNISVRTVQLLLANDPGVKKIRKGSALKILRGLGETPHPTLLQWKPMNNRGVANERRAVPPGPSRIVSPGCSPPREGMRLIQGLKNSASRDAEPCNDIPDASQRTMQSG